MTDAVTADRTSLVIVEDHAMVREMMAAKLTEAGYDVLGHAATAAEGHALYARHRPDVLLCDVRLDAKASGIDLTRTIVKAYPDAVIVMVSSEDGGEVIRSALDAGASGYVAKLATTDELVATISDALAGVADAADRHTYRQLIKDMQKPPGDGINLTARETDVLTLMARGTVTTAALAKALQVTPSSIRTYVEGCLRKLGVHTRGEAIAKAYKLGLIKTD